MPKIRLILGALLAALVCAGAAEAASPLTVVELFTSQGCNSCPPADAFALELMKRDDLLVLGYHVNYWDYLGWADTFATKETTQRQRGYMRPLRMQSLYTPQMVVGGRHQAPGGNRAEVERAIALARVSMPGGGADVRFEYREGAPFLHIEAPSEPVRLDGADVWLVLFADPIEVAIPRGENAGKTIAYANVVRAMVHLAKWDGLTTTYPLPRGTLAADANWSAAIVQMPNQGAIVGAAKHAVKKGGW